MLQLGMRFLLYVILSAVSLPATSGTWLHLYGISWHETPGYRETNTGVGIERQFSSRWSAAVGTFQNSVDQQSVVGMAKYHWINHSVWSVRWQLGGVTGYHGYTVAPIILPEACWHWICVMAIPAVGSETSAAAAFYLRIPL